MARLIVQAGPLTVVLKDDRAALKGDALEEWKVAAAELVEGIAGLVGYEEVVDDGE